jgi:hypothetical protein
LSASVTWGTLLYHSGFQAAPELLQERLQDIPFYFTMIFKGLQRLIPDFWPARGEKKQNLMENAWWGAIIPPGEKGKCLTVRHRF